jgi:hypothetical protein
LRVEKNRPTQPEKQDGVEKRNRNHRPVEQEVGSHFKASRINTTKAPTNKIVPQIAEIVALISPPLPVAIADIIAAQVPPMATIKPTTPKQQEAKNTGAFDLSCEGIFAPQVGQNLSSCETATLQFWH